jgi:hypothetical protein
MKDVEILMVVEMLMGFGEYTFSESYAKAKLVDGHAGFR